MHNLSPIIHTLHQMVCLLQLMNLHWHLIITQGPWFTSGLTLGVVHSMGLDKCIMTCVHHYSIIQSSFTTLKILCASPIHPSLPQPPATTHLFTVTVSIVFSRVSYSWNHTVL